AARKQNKQEKGQKIDPQERIETNRHQEETKAEQTAIHASSPMTTEDPAGITTTKIAEITSQCQKIDKADETEQQPTDQFDHRKMLELGQNPDRKTKQLRRQSLRNRPRLHRRKLEKRFG
uniref:Uncharacterized protein n=1 Tax=Caenorhabditis japonica TaxID=281687 RepID=A0A8R1IER1_CAEJA